MVGDAQNVLNQMGGNDDRPISRQLLDHTKKMVSLLRIQPHRGLVEQEHRRSSHDRARQRRSALLPTGQLPDPALCALSEVDRVHCLPDLYVARDPPQPRCVAHDIHHAHASR